MKTKPKKSPKPFHLTYADLDVIQYCLILGTRSKLPGKAEAAKRVFRKIQKGLKEMDNEPA